MAIHSNELRCDHPYKINVAKTVWVAALLDTKKKTPHNLHAKIRWGLLRPHTAHEQKKVWICAEEKCWDSPPLVLALLLAAIVVITASAEPVSETRPFYDVDWTSAGVGGVGGGSGVITVSGVTGTVSDAFLFWRGADLTANGGEDVYDNAAASINGNSVTGVSIGDASTNCWGSGSSRAYRTDVSQYVTGNGACSISGLSALAGHSANGASLILIHDDGNDTNNRDLVFYEGNDSNIPQGYPGDAVGWDANINYQGGGMPMPSCMSPMARLF